MGNVKNSVQIAAELSVNTKTFEGDVKNLLAKLDELQDAASIDLQFNNLKGVGNLRKTLNELDGILKHLADSSNATSKKLGSDISESTSKVVQDISLMSSKTGEFAEQLSVLANTGDLSKVQGKVKALAESINAELKDTGYQIDVEKLLNLGDAQQQIDMLSEGIRKFTAVWSFFGNTCVKATDGIKTGADNASNSIDNLKRKLEELKNVKTLLNKQLQSIEDGDETALKGEEKKNIRSFAAENLSTYTKAKDTFLNTADIEKKKQAFIEMTNAAYNLLRVLNTESDAFDFTDKKKDMIFGQSMSSAIEEMESFAAQFGKRIKQSIELEIENVKQQIANAEIDATPKVNMEPQPDPDGEKKVKAVVGASIPDKVEIPVETGLQVTIDESKFQELDQLITKHKGLKGKEKTSVRQEIVASIAELTRLGATIDQIKEKMSKGNTKIFSERLLQEVEALKKQVPTVVSEIDKLYQMLGADFTDEEKYSQIFKDVKSGALSAEESLELIKQKEEEIAAAAKAREEAQRKANEEGSKPKSSGGTAPPSGGTGTGTGGSGAGSSRTGVGAGTATPLATTNTEITNLEQLKAKLVEIQTEIARKTQAFNDENAAVSSVVSTELIEFEKLKAKLVEIKTSIDEKTSAFTNEQSVVTGVVDAEIVKLGELETKLESIAQKANIKINLNADDIKNLTTLDISTDNQDIAAEDKHNQELQKKAKIYQRLNERIAETIKLQQIVNSGNMYIMPEYRDNGNLVPGLGYGIGKGYTTDNHVTKTAIKNKIKDIQNLSATNESSKNDKSINRATDELAAFVATYKNLDEAKEVFGKKEIALWDEIIKRIELAKAAKDAYKKSDWNYQFMREDARTLGDSNTSYTIGDNDKLASFIKSGDAKGALGFLTEKFKIELDPEIESGAVLEEIKENMGNAPVPVEIKPTVDDKLLDNGQSSVELVSDSALSSTLSNINHTLEILNGTLSSFTTQNNQETPKVDIQGISNIATDVSNIYGILSQGDGENQALAKSVNSAVEALSNASKAIAEDAKQRVVEKKQSTNKTAPEIVNAKATNRASLSSINGVVKATQKQYESFSGTNEVPDRLKSDYAGLLSIIEDVRKANRAYSQEEINEIDKICRGIQDEIGLLKTKKEALTEQQSLSKKYTINTDDLFDTSKKGNIVGSGYEDKVKGIISEITNEVNKLKQTSDDGSIKILDTNEIENSKNRLKELNTELQNTIKEAQNASQGSFTKTYENQLGKVSAALKNFKTLTSDMNLDNSITDTVTKYEAALKKLNEIKTRLEEAPKGSDTSELEYQWRAALKEAQTYQKELEKIIDTSNKIENGTSIFDLNKGIDVNDIEQIRSAMEAYVQFIAEGKATIEPFDYENKQLTATFVDANGMIQKVTVSYDQLNHVVGQSITPVKKATTGWEKLTSTMGKKVREMAAYFATFGSMYQVIGVIKQGINYVKEIDLALTELKKVTNETDQAYEQFLQTASKTSSIIGSTVADFTNATADFARLGYSISEASKLAEAASVYKNVGDGIDSISQASESIISTMKAFGIEAEDAMGIVDRFNEVKVTCLLVW